MKFGKFFIAVFVLSVFSFSLATPVLAQIETNPLCWQEKDCVAQRKSILGDTKEASEGWIQNEDPCASQGWGKCLAGNVTVAEVSFGGNAQFTDIGVYIKTVYNYAMVVIGIIAVVVLIIAGAQWITSAGNSTTIAAAKKRIGGVIIGLFIAYMSYNILNTINPATINLRLPQVWLLRSIPLGEPPCMELAGKSGVNVYTKLQISTEFLESYKQLKQKQSQSTNLTETHMAMVHETWCGVVYNLPTPPGGKCKGSFCNGRDDSGTSNPVVKCSNDHPCSCYFDANSQLSYCKGASIGGTINVNGTKLITDFFAFFVRLYRVCKSAGSNDYLFVEQDSQGFLDDKTEYGFLIEKPGEGCDSPADFVGYFMVVKVHDANKSVVGTSYDDEWIVGKKSCGPGAKPIAGYNGFMDWNEGVSKPELQILIKDMVDSKFLWTADDLKIANTCSFITNAAPYKPGLSGDPPGGKKLFYP